MKHECPNCKQFTYEKGWSNRGCGWILLLGLPILIGMMPGASGFYGGTVDIGFLVSIIPLSMIIGVIVIIFSYISPQKIIDYTCSNCKFTQKHNI
jgi:hypothetical protein